MVTTPPAWTDPAGTSLDVATGGVWGTVAIDGLCSDLKALGGADGYSGLAQPRNLLVNGGMELNERGGASYSTNSVFTLDRWITVISGMATLTVSQDTVTVDGASRASLKMAYVANTGSAYVNQSLEDAVQLRGRTLSVSARVYSSVAGAKIALGDSATTTNSALSQNVNAWETLTVTATIGAATTAVNVFLFPPASGSSTVTTYWDNAMLVLGAMPPAYVPLPQQEDLARAQRYYEKLAEPGDNTLIISGVATAGAQVVYVTLPYKQKKPVAPTATLVGTWGVTNCGQPTILVAGRDGLVLQVQSTAAGVFSAVNNAAGNTVTVESNP